MAIHLKEAWEKAFAGPLKHRPDKFCYLIHVPSPKDYGLDARDGYTYDESKNISLWDDPFSIHNKTLISASIISEYHLGIYQNYDAGLILRCPFENVVTMYPGDLETSEFNDPEITLDEIADKIQIVSIEELLTATRQRGIDHDPNFTDYDIATCCENEVLLRGATKFGRVETIGAFIIADRPDYQEAGKKKSILNLAKAHNLPIVALQDKSVFDFWQKGRKTSSLSTGDAPPVL